MNRREAPTFGGCLLLLGVLGSYGVESLAFGQELPATTIPADEVRVQGVRSSARETGTPVRRVDGRSLELSPRASLLESIALETPGLYVNARGPFAGVSFGGAGAMRLRGLGGSPNTEILVLEDGVPDMMGLFGHPVPDAYFPAYLAGAEVIPGGDSVLYGNGAMAGVLSFRTRWAHHEGEEIRLSGQGGSYTTNVFQAGLLGKRQGVDYLAMVRTTHSAGHRDYAGGDETGTLGKVRYALAPGVDITLRQRVLIAHTFDPGPASRPFSNHFIDFRRYNQALTLRHGSNAWTGRVTAYGNLGDHRLFDGFHSHDSLFGLWIDEQWKPEAHTTLMAGLDARSSGGSGEDVITKKSYGTYRIAWADPYQQVTVQPSTALRLVAGLRQHLSALRDPMLLKKVGVEIALPSAVRVAARYVENYREPTVVERYFPFPVANASLRPERSTTLDITLGWSPSEQLDVSVTGYQTSANDYIRQLGAYPAFLLENIESLRFRGLEGKAKVRIVGPLTITVTGAITQVGKYTAQTPTRTATGNIAYEHGAWRAALTGMYAGGLFQKDFSQQPLDDPWQIDARIDHALAQGHVRLWVIARNLTNHRYAYIADYPMPGVNIMLGIELMHEP